MIVEVCVLRGGGGTRWECVYITRRKRKTAALVFFRTISPSLQILEPSLERTVILTMLDIHTAFTDTRTKKKIQTQLYTREGGGGGMGCVQSFFFINFYLSHSLTLFLALPSSASCHPTKRLVWGLGESNSQAKKKISFFFFCKIFELQHKSRDLSELYWCI